MTLHDGAPSESPGPSGPQPSADLGAVLAETMATIAFLSSAGKPRPRERRPDLLWVQRVDGQLRTLVVQAKWAPTMPSASGPG